MPEFVKAIGAARFGVMAGVAAALTAFFLYVAGALTEPPKAILFSGLEPRDAAAVTAKLDAMNEKYEAKGDGGTILYGCPSRRTISKAGRAGHGGPHGLEPLSHNTL